MPPSRFSTALSPLILLLLQLHSTLSADSHSPFCSSFNSSPPFPFSTSPGYGHPSFLIDCRSNRSIITVSNISFSIHQFRTNLLTLSPFPSYPCQTQPINLSSSPFHLSNSTCSKLACTDSDSTLLKPHNCTLTSHVRQFLRKPLPFFPDCLQGTPHHCHRNESTVILLQSGIELEWRPDSYYSDCNTCKTEQNGVCGYNDSDPSKPFVCLHGRRSDGREQIALFGALFTIACLLLLSAVAFTIVRCRCLGSTAAGEREELERQHSSNESVVYVEKVVNNGVETVAAVRGLDNFHDLYIVGRGQGSSQLTAAMKQGRWLERRAKARLLILGFEGILGKRVKNKRSFGWT